MTIYIDSLSKYELFSCVIPQWVICGIAYPTRRFNEVEEGRSSAGFWDSLIADINYSKTVSEFGVVKTILYLIIK